MSGRVHFFIFHTAESFILGFFFERRESDMNDFLVKFIGVEAGSDWVCAILVGLGFEGLQGADVVFELYRLCLFVINFDLGLS